MNSSVSLALLFALLVASDALSIRSKRSGSVSSSSDEADAPKQKKAARPRPPPLSDPAPMESIQLNGSAKASGVDRVLKSARDQVAGVEDSVAKQMLEGHILQLDKLQNGVEGNEQTIQTHARRISDTTAGITELGVRMDNHRKHYDQTAGKLREGINTNVESIGNLNAHAKYLEEEQSDQQKEIEGLDNRQKEYQTKVDGELAEQQSTLDTHTGDISKIDGNLVKQSNDIAANSNSLKRLNSEQRKTNDRMEKHSGELQVHGNDVKDAVNNISDLTRKGEQQDSAIKGQKSAYDAYVVEDTKRDEGYRGRFTGIDGNIAGLKKDVADQTETIGTHRDQITNLKGNLVKETDERSRVQQQFGAQLESQKGLIGDQGTQLDKMGIEQKTLGETVDTMGESYRALDDKFEGEKISNAAQFAKHQTGIDTNNDDIGTLRGTVTDQGTSIDEASDGITELRKQHTDTRAIVDRTATTLKEHTGEIDTTKQQLDKFQQHLHKHCAHLNNARSANDKLKSAIDGVQTDLNGKSDALHLRVNSIDKQADTNTKEIGRQQGLLTENGKQIDELGSTVKIHGTRLDSYKGRHEKTDSKLLTINERFDQQHSKVQALLEGQKKIDDAITAAQQAVTKKLAESGAAMLKATKLAVENSKDAVNVVDQKMEEIAEIQKAQQEILNTPNLKQEAAKNQETTDEFIANKIEEAAAAAA